MNNLMREAGPDTSGEVAASEGDDSNMGTVPTSGPEATSSQGTHRILTHFDSKPIPDRRWDWCATLDNYDVDCDERGYFSHCPIGYGATEKEAIDELLEQLANT